MKATEEIIRSVAAELSKYTLITGIGITSNPALIEDEGGDMDIFVYCTGEITKGHL